MFFYLRGAISCDVYKRSQSHCNPNQWDRKLHFCFAETWNYSKSQKFLLWIDKWQKLPTGKMNILLQKQCLWQNAQLMIGS